MRECQGCKQMLPLSSFWRQASRTDGYQAKCAGCMSSSHKRWRAGQSQKAALDRSMRNVEASRRHREVKPRHQMLNSIRGRAKVAGLECTLTLDDLVIPERCPVLGIPLRFGIRRGNGLVERDCRPSVDRIDNSRGYTPDNIVVVSYRANRLKSDATPDELAALAAFYCGGPNANSVGNPEPARDQRAGHERDKPLNLSAVQCAAAEQERPLPQRDDQRRGGPGALPSLRLEHGGTVR